MYLLAQSYGYNDITEELEFTITFSNPLVPSGKRVLGFQFTLPVKFPTTFVEITGSEPFLLSGLRIETTTENWLKTFSIEYAKEYFLSPNKMTPLNEIGFEKLVCIFKIFHVRVYFYSKYILPSLLYLGIQCFLWYQCH